MANIPGLYPFFEALSSPWAVGTVGFALVVAAGCALVSSYRENKKEGTNGEEA